MNGSYYTGTPYDASAMSGLAGTIAAMGLFVCILSMALSILMIVSYWKIFVKAGKPGWAAIVPIYNFIVMCEIAEKPWWYVLLLCVPIANIYAMVVVYNGIAKKFGKGTGYTAGMILLPVIFMPMLAFEKNNVLSDDMSTSAVSDVQNNFNDVSSNNSNAGYQAPVFNEHTSSLNMNATEENVAPTFDNVMPNQNSVAPINQNMEQAQGMPSVNPAPMQDNVAPTFNDMMSQNQVNVNQNNTMDSTNVNSLAGGTSQEMPQSNPAMPNTFAQPNNTMQNAVNLDTTNVAEQNVSNTNMMNNNINMNAQMPNADTTNTFANANVSEPQNINDANVAGGQVQNEVHTSMWSNNNNQNNGQM